MTGSGRTSALRHGRDRAAVIVGAVVIVVLLVLYAAALVRGGADTPRLGASLEEVLADPDDVVGERWAIAAEVRDVVGAELILVGGREFGIDALPVLLTSRARELVDEGIAAGDVGQFVGRFRRLDVSQLEREVRTDLPDERLAHLEEGLVLVADRAAVDQRTE